jgi:hypothetical protein
MLYQHPDATSISKLFQTLLSDPNESICAMALIAWCIQVEAHNSRSRDADVATQRESSMKHQSASMRRSAVMLLGAGCLHAPVERQSVVAQKLSSLLQASSENASVRLMAAKLLIIMNNDRDAYGFVIDSLRSDDVEVRGEAIACLKDKIGLFVENTLIRHLLETVGEINKFDMWEQGEVAVLLRRIRPEIYEQMGSDLLSKDPISRGYIESLWLHMGSSARGTPTLCDVEAALLADLCEYPEVCSIIRALQEPLSLPLVTDIFEESFVLKNLGGKPLSDESCQGSSDGGTNVAGLNRCCDAIDGVYLTLQMALFGPGYCLTSGMNIEGVSIENVRVAVNKCKDDILSDKRFSTGALGVLDKDMLLAIRVYTVVEPPIYKLLNFPFYNPNNRIPGSLLNQLPYMKYLLQSYDTIFASAPQFVFSSPGFRGMNTEHSEYLRKKYTNWEEEYSRGRRLTFPSFTSISLDMTKAEQYARKGTGQSIIYIFAKVTGLRLGILSTEIEQEVLLKPPAVFIIADANMSDEGILSVYLEVDATNTLTYL